MNNIIGNGFNKAYNFLETPEEKNTRINYTNNLKKIGKIALVSAIVALVASIFATCFLGTVGIILGLPCTVLSFLVIHDVIKSSERLENLINNHWERFKLSLEGKGVTESALRQEVVKETIVLKHFIK